MLNAKTHSLTIAINTLTSYSFDKCGRLIGAFMEGVNYKRGLDNTVLSKWSETEKGRRRRKRRILAQDERAEFLDRMTETLKDIRQNSGRYNIEIPGEEEATWLWFDKCITRDREELEADAKWFSTIYKPVTILPPDQYYSLVVQISEGCSYNKCTFCNFYRDRRFRIKSPEEVERHIREVNEFFGESLGLRQSVFLADANALIIPQARLLDILKIINERYTFLTESDQRRELHRRRRQGDVVFDGIYSFIDLFTGEHKSRDEFSEMANLGVKRVYIGMESGSEALLEFLNKPGSKGEMIEAVNKVKAGGVDVGLIILVGAGGRKYQEQHIKETTDALNAMNLDARDFIYFSEFRPQPGTPYQHVAEAEGVHPLSPEQTARQEELLREGLRYPGKENSPRITTYDIREFLY